MKKTRFITKEDRAVLSAAKKVLKKIARKAARLESVRRKADFVQSNRRDAENGARWKKASLDLYGLLDEVDKTKLVTLIGNSAGFAVAVPVDLWA